LCNEQGVDLHRPVISHFHRTYKKMHSPLPERNKNRSKKQNHLILGYTTT
jgi:hypothetical protein